MIDFTPVDPQYSDTIKILETTDPGHCDNVNITTKKLQENIAWLKKNGADNIGIATDQEVIDMADELMGETPIPPEEEIATDEEVEEMIEGLPDL